MSKLFVLQIAINDYPTSSVSALKGAIPDLDLLHTYLKKYHFDKYASVIHLSHKNEAATRANIISSFESMAAQAQAKDVVLVTYSGHGVKNRSAPEFGKDSYDNCWYLYDSHQNLSLADKEIAKLCENFNPEVELIFISDSCHAGTIMRDKGVARFTEGSKEPRPLHTYYGNYSKDNIWVPERRSISITACDDEESAYEEYTSNMSARQGVFTRELIQLLDENKARINYQDLDELLRNRVRIHKQQTPQLDVLDGFNCRRFFLSSEVDYGDTFLVTHDSNRGRWKIPKGIIHGLQENMNLEVTIFNPDNPEILPFVTTINEVGFQESYFKHDPEVMDFKTYLVAYFSKIQKPTIHFSLNALKPEQVEQSEDPKVFEQFGELRKHLLCQFKSKGHFWSFGSIKESKYHVVAKTTEVGFTAEIYDTIGFFTAQSQPIFSFPIPLTEFIAFKDDLFMALDHIERWERFRALKSPYSSEGNVELKLILDGELSPDHKLCLKYEKPIPYQVMLNNTTGKIFYCKILIFDKDFKVREQNLKLSDTVIKSKPNKFNLEEGESKKNILFKLIAAEEIINGQPFEQENLESAFGSGKKSGGDMIEFDKEWFTYYFEVDIVRDPV